LTGSAGPQWAEFPAAARYTIYNIRAYIDKCVRTGIWKKCRKF
jgi:hypothetical protein